MKNARVMIIRLPLVSGLHTTYLEHVVAFGRFINLRMELLFGPSVAVSALVSVFAVGGFSPLVAVFNVGARRRPVFEGLRTPSAVFVVVVLRASVSLAAEPRRTTALVRLVVRQHESRALPFRIFS